MCAAHRRVLTAFAPLLRIFVKRLGCFNNFLCLLMLQGEAVAIDVADVSRK